jgi:hypothetical protein
VALNKTAVAVKPARTVDKHATTVTLFGIGLPLIIPMLESLSYEFEADMRYKFGEPWQALPHFT